MFPNTNPSQPMSMIGYFSFLLGSYALLIPLSAVVALIITVALVWRGRPPFAGAALQLVVPLPLLLSLIGMFHYEAHASWNLLTQVDESTPMFAPLGIGVAFPMVGLLGACPSFVVAMLGSLKRSAVPSKTPDAGTV